ncbi:ABC transporter permease [Luteococcus sanguinis]|uniref:ABC transporter permease n=1 Tax=Luteococcus sanguinis TaxID=174038 RepID=A0ABW1WZZ4_9ACTN
MIVALELGLLFAIMALGVYLTFRILDFPDLTVDGSYTTGAAVAAVLIINGTNPWLATLAALLSGLVAGLVTGLLHTKGRINPLLAGILTQIALYSINLRIMGRANLPLLRQSTILDPMREHSLLGTWASVGIFAVVALALKFALDWFLGTDLGLALRATGDNPEMASAQGVRTDSMKLLGVSLSNGLVAACGAIIAQFQGYADISMGIGLIVAGLASVILGQALIGRRVVAIATAAVVLGSVAYRAIIQLALNAGLNPNDMKLISALLVIAALLLPRFAPFRRYAQRKRVQRERDAQAVLVDEKTLVDEQSLAQGVA